MQKIFFYTSQKFLQSREAPKFCKNGKTGSYSIIKIFFSLCSLYTALSFNGFASNSGDWGREEGGTEFFILGDPGDSQGGFRIIGEESPPQEVLPEALPEQKQAGKTLPPEEESKSQEEPQQNPLKTLPEKEAESPGSEGQVLNFDEDQEGLGLNFNNQPESPRHSVSSEESQKPITPQKKPRRKGPSKNQEENLNFNEDSDGQGLNFGGQSENSEYSVRSKKSEKEEDRHSPPPEEESEKPEQHAQSNFDVIGSNKKDEKDQECEFGAVTEYNSVDDFLNYYEEFQKFLKNIPDLFEKLRMFFQNEELGDWAIQLRREKAVKIFNSSQNETPETESHNPLKIPDYVEDFTTLILELDDNLCSLSSKIKDVRHLGNSLQQTGLLEVPFNGVQRTITDLLENKNLKFQDQDISLADLNKMGEIWRQFFKDIQSCFDKRYAPILKEEKNFHSVMEILKTPEHEKWGNNLGCFGLYLLKHISIGGLRELSFSIFKDYFSIPQGKDALKALTPQEKVGWVMFWILNQHKNLNWIKAAGEKEKIFEAFDLIKACHRLKGCEEC